MLLECKRLKGVATYKLASETQPSEYTEYMLILEFDNKEGFEAYQASPERVAAVEESETHDWRGLHSVKQRVQYELVKSWGR
jgi:antibiotic biosynthesis monooxygenase (ABM) superfamily enzyme